ncbi:DUF4233 domain-containing protein [Gordonia phosphorivorans]|uniref:DUF4233 domain-containing protein n=1 Tax=Gordonia phosphorivorans TaxID=1056982 RepID=A0ABV6H877_9ACTN
MTTSPEFSAPPTDPWKGFRGIMAAVLILEAIVVGLTFPVVATLGGGVSWASGLYLGLVCLLLVVLSGMQRRPYALPVNLAMQVLVILGGLFHWSIAVVGVVFTCVWIYIVYVKRDVERRIERGQLPGQQPL